MGKRIEDWIGQYRHMDWAVLYMRLFAGGMMLFHNIGKMHPEFIKEVKRETDRDLERDMGGVKVIRKQLYSREERIARALEVIEANGLITLSDYAYINNLSRTAASLELKEITADRTSPIGSMGSGSHKVWVKRKA